MKKISTNFQVDNINNNKNHPEKFVENLMSSQPNPIQIQPQIQHHSIAIIPTLSSSPLFTTTKIRLRQPFKILADIWGVLTPYSFRNELYRYIDDNIINYLMNNNLDNDELHQFIVELARRTTVDREKYPEMQIIVADDCCNDKLTKVNAIVKNLQFRQQHEDSAQLMAGLDMLFNLIWIEG